MKHFTLTIILLFIFNIAVYAQWKGSGIQQNPYQISSINDLILLNNSVDQGKSYHGVYFSLTEDLDFEGFKQTWIPIGLSYNRSFNGCFMGNGYKIKNLTMNNIHTTYPSISYVGLFGYINSSDALIDNLHIENVTIIGNSSVGGLVANLLAGTISNCTVTGTIAGVEYAGGIVCINFGEMVNCTFTGAVHGNKSAGALSGKAIAEFRNCTARGLVYEKGKLVEKLVGESQKVTAISCEFTQDENWKTSLKETPVSATAAAKIKLIALNKFDTDFRFCDGLLGIRNNETGKWGFI